MRGCQWEIFKAKYPRTSGFHARTQSGLAIGNRTWTARVFDIQSAAFGGEMKPG